MVSLSWTPGNATTPSGSTVIKTYIPPWIRPNVSNHKNKPIQSTSNREAQTLWLTSSRSSALKISFSVLSSFLSLFVPTSEIPFFNCKEKIVGICHLTTFSISHKWTTEYERHMVKGCINVQKLNMISSLHTKCGIWALEADNSEISCAMAKFP